MKEPNSLETVLDDLIIRFVINSPDEELEHFDRLLFQVEEAHWYYEDFFREKIPSLPLLNLKQFASHLFQRCPLLRPYQEYLENIYASFTSYKIQIPVCGAILLNQNMDQCVLVKGWNSRTWGFPRGKKNKNEPEIECATREVLEETGYDISSLVLEEDFIELTRGPQNSKLYIVRGVSESFKFGPKARKEIRKVEWHRLEDLMLLLRKDKNALPLSLKPNSFFMVLPYLRKLKTWIAEQRRQSRRLPSPTVSERKSIVDPVSRSYSFSAHPAQQAVHVTLSSSSVPSPKRISSQAAHAQHRAVLPVSAPWNICRDISSVPPVVPSGPVPCSPKDTAPVSAPVSEVREDSQSRSCGQCYGAEASMKTPQQKTSPFLNFRFDRAELLQCLSVF